MTTAIQMRLTHFVNFFWVNRLMLSKLTVTKILRGALCAQRTPGSTQLTHTTVIALPSNPDTVLLRFRS